MLRKSVILIVAVMIIFLSLGIWMYLEIKMMDKKINVSIGDTMSLVFKNTGLNESNVGKVDGDVNIYHTMRGSYISGVLHPFKIKKYIYFEGEVSDIKEMRVTQIDTEISIKWLNDKYCFNAIKSGKILTSR